MIPRSHIISEDSNYGLYRHGLRAESGGGLQRRATKKLFAVLVFAVRRPRLRLSGGDGRGPGGVCPRVCVSEMKLQTADRRGICVT